MTIAPGDESVLRGMRLGITGLNTGYVAEDEQEKAHDRDQERLERERKEEQERLAREKEEHDRIQQQRKIEHEERIQRLKQERMERERIRKRNEQNKREREEEERRLRERKEKEKAEKERRRLQKEKEQREKERKERERYVSYTSLLQPRNNLIEFLVTCLTKNIFLRATLVGVNILDFEDVFQFDLSLYVMFERDVRARSARTSLLSFTYS
jgi:hypothetical protein